ncbi:hypothetical protein T4C_6303, partial [Trichinella pseudospiralis]
MKVVIHHQTNFQFQEKEVRQDKVLLLMTQYQDWPFQNVFCLMICHVKLLT